MSTFTSAPWLLEARGGNGRQFEIVTIGGAVAEIETSEANAVLMTAAPELLATIEAFLAATDSSVSLEEERRRMPGIRKRMRDVIAEARGAK